MKGLSKVFKLFSFICIVTMLSYPGTIKAANYDTSWYNDLDSNFHIQTSQQLFGLAYLCNNGTSFKNKTIILDNDIVLSDNWTALGRFDGTFDGNYCSISNFKMQKNSIQSFIVNLTESGVLKNLEFKEGSISSDATMGAGFVYTNDGTISQCVNRINVLLVYSDVNELPSIRISGGITGINNGLIIDCENYGDVTAKTSYYTRSTNAYAGGIAAQNYGKIFNSINYGNIFSHVGMRSHYWNSIAGPYPRSYSAGIGNNYSEGAITNCINYGNIKSVIYDIDKFNSGGGNSGAISSSSLNIINCYYVSSSNIEGASICKSGTCLSIDQATNKTFDFVALLNENNNSIISCSPCFWACSPNYKDGFPFLINAFNIKGVTSSIATESIEVSLSPNEIISSAISQAGFEYKNITETSWTTIYFSDPFQYKLSNLNSGNTYEFRFFVHLSNGQKIWLNSIKSTTTDLIVETLDAENITPYSATLRSRIDLGSSVSNSKGFLWKNVIDDTYKTIYLENNESKFTLSGLSPNTLYQYQVYVILSSGENYYGDIVYFRTEPIKITIENITPQINDIIVDATTNTINDCDLVFNIFNKDGEVVQEMSSTSNGGRCQCTFSNLEPYTPYTISASTIINNIKYKSDLYNTTTQKVKIISLMPDVDSKVVFKGQMEGLPLDGTLGFEFRKCADPDLIESQFLLCTSLINSFSADTYELENNIQYKFRAFYSNTAYTQWGEWIEFIPKNVSTNILIENFEIDTNTVYYDLAGYRIKEKPQKGIYIEKSNGKTRLVIN